MAKTLFFIEAFLFAALAFVAPLRASELTISFLAPLALSLIGPLACALAIWPAKEVAAAFRRVFSAERDEKDAAESLHILQETGTLCGRFAVAGILISVIGALPRIALGEKAENIFLLGAYLSLYAILSAAVARILSKVVQGIAPASPLPAEDEGARFAARYGLTRREGEVAACIASGLSYKGAAERLGISIKTVKTHITHVYEKTGCGTNVGLVLLLKAEAGPGPGGANSAPIPTKSR